MLNKQNFSTHMEKKLTYREVSTVLKKHGWQNASFQTLVSQHIPRAKTLLQKSFEVEVFSDEEIKHILHFLKPFCIEAKVHNWDLETMMKKLESPPIPPLRKNTVPDSILRDAQVREWNMIHAMGGLSYYKLLFQ